MIFLQIIKRELKIATRKQAEILNPLWFFLIVITLFPLVIGPDPKLLSRIAPGVAWVAALLSALLSFERLFRDDFIDGSLEQLMLSDCCFIALIRSEYLVGIGAYTLSRHADFKLHWRNWCGINGGVA